MTENPPTPSRRKRGGQPGNNNAVKHGFYTHSFHTAESGRLDAGLLGKFADEIDLMRVLILRTADSIKDSSHMTREEYLSSLRGITLAVARLESIYRTQKAVYETETTLESALAELDYLDWDQD